MEEITGDYWRSLEVAVELEITGDYYWRLLLRLLEISVDYWKLLDITGGDYWRLLLRLLVIYLRLLEINGEY